MQLKIDPQASQQASSSSESVPAYFFERDCFVDSLWGALWSDVLAILERIWPQKAFPA